MTEVQTKSKPVEVDDENDAVMKETFDMFDKDHSGFICEKEFAQAARALGCNPTDKELADFMSEMDKDRTRTIDFDEFKVFYSKYKSKHTDEKVEITNAFRLFDKDGNGYIEAKELKRVLSNLGQHMTDEEIDEMIGTADGNKDGKINIEEFSAFITQK